MACAYYALCLSCVHKVRVLEEEGFVDVLRLQPPPRLKQLYAEKHCKVRLHTTYDTSYCTAHYTTYSTVLTVLAIPARCGSTSTLRTASAPRPPERSRSRSSRSSTASESSRRARRATGPSARPLARSSTPPSSYRHTCLGSHSCTCRCATTAPVLYACVCVCLCVCVCVVCAYR